MKKYGFTLAEVLITLGIIGIVAAMTLPTLIAKNQEKVLETQRKKAASVLANGYKMMLAQNEVFKIRELPLYKCAYSTNATGCVEMELKNVFKIVAGGITGSDFDINLPEMYTDTDNTELVSPWMTGILYTFITPDGFVYGLDLESLTNLDAETLRVYADVNGAKNPNTAGKDLIGFNISENGSVYEVSTDLGCNRNNPRGCKTEEGCMSINECWSGVGGTTHCRYEWRNGICRGIPY